jgi:hypothetical protein
MTREEYYRLIDGMYRLHEDLYQLEDVTARAAVGQFRLARIRTASAQATAVGGFFVLAPILVSISGLEWSDAPIVSTLLIAGGLTILTGYQIWDSARLGRKLQISEKYHTSAPLARRIDYALEQINSYANRIRVLDELLQEYDQRIGSAGPGDKTDLATRRERWQAVRDQCVSEVERIVEESSQLVRSEARTSDQHKTVERWAAPFRRSAS